MRQRTRDRQSKKIKDLNYRVLAQKYGRVWNSEGKVDEWVLDQFAKG